jgi:biopolymer transport protein ExbB
MNLTLAMSEMTNAPQSLAGTWARSMDIWSSGGWAMAAIATVAMVMFAIGLHIYLRLMGKGFKVPEQKWRRWIEHPEEREGKVGEFIGFATTCDSVQEMGVRFEEIRKAETAPFQRDLMVMKICVSAAPLLGLLGTVMGMLTTFTALSTGAGGDETMGAVAGGISEALVTTATGLIVALPGLFLQDYLRRKHDAYKAFLAHLETVCAQHKHRSLQQRAKAA